MNLDQSFKMYKDHDVEADLEQKLDPENYGLIEGEHIVAKSD